MLIEMDDAEFDYLSFDSCVMPAARILRKADDEFRTPFSVHVATYELELFRQ
jgi:hypothetical protein